MNASEDHKAVRCTCGAWRLSGHPCTTCEPVTCPWCGAWPVRLGACDRCRKARLGDRPC